MKVEDRAEARKLKIERGQEENSKGSSRVECDRDVDGSIGFPNIDIGTGNGQ